MPPAPSQTQSQASAARASIGQTYIDQGGAFLGHPGAASALTPAIPLLKRDASGLWQPRERPALERVLSKGYGAPLRLGSRAVALRDTAEALNRGDLPAARRSLRRLALPPLPGPASLRLMAEADARLGQEEEAIAKVAAGGGGAWRLQPRLPKGVTGGGEFTSGGGGVTTVADKKNPTALKKENFVTAHLKDAQEVANQLHVPVANILGLSALEGNWGESRFATQGNNFFGQQYPANNSNGFMWNADGTRQMATFDSYAASLKSFATKFGSVIDGVTDPVKFATALQGSGAFGIDTTTKKPDPHYIKGVSDTIKGLASYIQPGKH